MRLSVIADEIDPVLVRQLDVCEELGLDGVELRTVDGMQVIDHTPEQLHGIREELDRRGLPVCAVASPFLKCARGEDQKEVLERTLTAAAILGAPVVRAFSWWRESSPVAVLPELGPVLREAAGRAAAAGVTLALENEHECNVATSDEARAALDAADARELGLIWDPGNAAMLEPATFSGLGGLESIADRVVHVHLKDVTAGGEWTRVGDGIVDFPKLVSYLDAIGYDGYLSFETHYQRDGSGELATRDCVAALRAIAS